MKLFHVFAVVAFVTVIPSKAESPQLKIYTRPADTVYTAEVNIVAVTEPDAKADINGEDMHVFPTGSFGMPVQVKPGVNTITVRAGKDGKTTQKTFTVFRADESVLKKILRSMNPPRCLSIRSVSRLCLVPTFSMAMVMTALAVQRWALLTRI